MAVLGQLTLFPKAQKAKKNPQAKHWVVFVNCHADTYKQSLEHISIEPCRKVWSVGL